MRQVIKFFVQHHIVGDLLMFAILVSGFVGLALADYIQPWCTFVKSVEKVAK